MFSVLKAGSFTKLKRKNSLNIKPVDSKHVNFQQKKIKLENIVGPKFRSRNGCLNCKKRRRRCDETLPCCTSCASRGLDCVYKKEAASSGSIEHAGDKDLVVLEEEKASTPVLETEKALAPALEEDRFQPLLRTEGDNKWLTKTPRLCSNVVEDVPSMDPIGNLQHYDLPSPTVIKLSFLPTLLLNERGLKYLDYYKSKVTKLLAIGLDNTNYFAHLYYCLANEEECFTYALTAWGAFYSKQMIIDSDVVHYLRLAFDSFNRLPVTNDKRSFYIKTCFLQTLIGIYICFGDSAKWKVLFENCTRQFLEYGGLEKIAKDFNYTNEVRFLISNYQYHDVMASDSCRSGTAIPISVYHRVFNDTHFDDIEYGLDTLQGCNQPIILLLGEIMNHKVIIDSKLAEMASLTDADDNLNDEEAAVYAKIKEQYGKLVESSAYELDYKIENVQPNVNLLNSIKFDPDEVLLHENYFKLYKVCCRIYWYLYIKRIPPNYFAVQDLVAEGFDTIDQLIGTKMIVALCLPLIVVGICCGNKFDKYNLEKRFKRIKECSPVDNTAKSWIIVCESWNRNPHGNLIIDWTDICNEFEWELNVC